MYFIFKCSVQFVCFESVISLVWRYSCYHGQCNVITVALWNVKGNVMSMLVLFFLDPQC